MQQQIGGGSYQPDHGLYIYGHHHHRWTRQNPRETGSTLHQLMASPAKVGLATCRISQHQRRDSTKIHNDLDVGQTRWISPESSVHQKLPSLAAKSWPSFVISTCPVFSVPQTLSATIDTRTDQRQNCTWLCHKKKKVDPTAGGISSISSMWCSKSASNCSIYVQKKCFKGIDATSRKWPPLVAFGSRSSARLTSIHDSPCSSKKQLLVSGGLDGRQWILAEHLKGAKSWATKITSTPGFVMVCLSPKIRSYSAVHPQYPQLIIISSPIISQCCHDESTLYIMWAI